VQGSALVRLQGSALVPVPALVPLQVQPDGAAARQALVRVRWLPGAAAARQAFAPVP
jgi:hypothetical protein